MTRGDRDLLPRELSGVYIHRLLGVGSEHHAGVASRGQGLILLKRKIKPSNDKADRPSVTMSRPSGRVIS